MRQRVLSLARGIVRVEVSCKYPERFLNLCAANGIEFWGVRLSDDGTVLAYLRESGFRRLRELSSKHGFEVQSVTKAGAPAFMRKIRRRTILVAGLIAIFLITRILSLFVWDISVYGNENVTTPQIMEALSQLGFSYGTFGLSVHSEELADRMILRLPELSWFAVNIRGSHADILVRERTPKPEIADANTPAMVFAVKSGVITKLRVLAGAATVGIGDTVEAGELLVTGVLGSRSSGDRTVHALAGVEARTWYELSAQMPVAMLEKRYSGDEKKRRSLIFLEKKINLQLNSGISWTDYDKIVTEQLLTLPGGVTLPVRLITETYYEYEPVKSEQTRERMRELLAEGLSRRLENAVGDGEIISAAWDFVEENGVMTATLNAECLEQIAVSVELSEEELSHYSPAPAQK